MLQGPRAQHMKLIIEKDEIIEDEMEKEAITIDTI